MKFYTTFSVRNDWTPQDLVFYDLGPITIEELAEKLKQYTSGKSLLVEISLWNEERRDEIVADQK